MDIVARSGVTSFLKDIMVQLLANEPQDPIVFISQYFENVVNSTPTMTRVYRLIMLCTDYEDDTFVDNLSDAYLLLASTNSGNGRKGITGQMMMELLGMLCSDYSPHAANMLLRRFQRDSEELISFHGFRRAVTTCLMYGEFIARAEALFTSLDAKNLTGYVDKSTCEKVLENLLSTSSPAVREREIEEARMAWLESKEPITSGVNLPEFLRSASNLFLKVLACL